MNTHNPNQVTVVLSALVTVAAGQYVYHYPGVPADTPEVYNAKIAHSIAWNNAAARSLLPHTAPAVVLGRKRREAPAVAKTLEIDEAQPAKRQIFASWAPLNPWSSRAYPIVYPTYSAWYKKRDTAEAESNPSAPISRQRRDTSAAEESSDREKRQLFYTSPTLTYPYAPLAYSAYSAYPAAAIPYSALSWYKKRDTAETESNPSAPISRQRRDTSAAEESSDREKRQLFYTSPTLTYPYAPLAYSAYSAYPAAAIPYSALSWYKKRDTAETESNPSAPISRQRRDTSAAEESSDREKRQLFYTSPTLTYPYAPLAYSAYPAATIPYSALSWYKKRDTAETESNPSAPISRQRRDTSAAEESSDREKRQLFYTSPALTYPYAPLAYSAYSAYPAAAIPYSALSWYKKRDTAETESNPSAPISRQRRDTSAAEESSDREKRQLFYTSPALTYPYAPLAYSAYSAYPATAIPYSALSWYKKRDTAETESNQSAPISRQRRDTSAAMESSEREKRQLVYSSAYTTPFYQAYPYVALHPSVYLY